jgi:hypothetical protein
MMAFSLITFLGMLGPVLIGRHDSQERTLILIGLLLISFVTFLLGRTSFYKWGAVLLVFGLAATGFALVLTGQANDSSDALNTTLPLVLIIGSALLSLRAQFFLTLFCGFGPMLLPLISARVTAADGMLRNGGVFLVFGLLLMGITVFRNRLEKTRLDELGALNLALQAIQTTLEQRVTERTSLVESARAEAEAARNEAESARREVESQMWMTAGQAILAEKIRGEQGVSQLAESIITQISRYLGAHAGALYLMEKGTLNMLGGYAFTARPGFSGKFQIGEGLVGQSAADRRVIQVTRPENAAIISTGLLDFAPRQVLVAPFEDNGQVAGIIELVTLVEFTPAHVNFLARVSESIGVVFRTAQTRQRLADLLMESQQQAEELQTQEEELRAANEELQAQAEHMKSNRKNQREMSVKR